MVMHLSIRLFHYATIVLLLAACSSVASPAPTVAPTQASAPAPTIAPTALPTFAAGSTIGGIDISGMQPDQAAVKLKESIGTLHEPIDIKLETEQFTIDPKQLQLQVPVELSLEKASAGLTSGQSVSVPLEIIYDEAALRQQLTTLSEKIATPGQTRLITETDRYSRTFVFEPGMRLDLDQAVAAVEQRLREPQASRSVALRLSQDGTPAPVGIDEIRSALKDMIERWDGVVGIYLYDIKSGETVLVNEKTVFSGASVLKVPIMLQSYISIPSLTADEKQLMAEMIGESDNMAANALLAKVVDGEGTEAALDGVRKMNETMQELGLKHTYQNLPYEAGDYLINVRKMKIPKGPAQEGEAPFTEADPYVRTTPAEIGQLLLWIRQCSEGSGPLLERFADSLSAERCSEMIDWLRHNEDTTRMVAGFPPGTDVAHKSGWIEDMQADAGIVSTPGGDFVLALYFYQQQRNSYLADEIAAPIIAAFARLVYSGYNPTVQQPTR